MQDEVFVIRPRQMTAASITDSVISKMDEETSHPPGTLDKETGEHEVR